MIDLHTHLLPGLDDGAPDLPAALALARAASTGGTRAMVATPHIDHHYRIRPLELAGRVADLQGELAGAGIRLDVHAGGELAPERALDLAADELDAIALGASRCLLLECPFTESGGLMGNLVADFQRRGFRVLLAHPERSPTFLREPERLAELVRRGAFVQVTGGSFAGDFGRTARRYARALVQRDLVHVVASDAHDTDRRAPLAPAALERHGVAEPLIEWLTDAVPQALLADAEPPARPGGRARRSIGLRRR